MRPGLHNLAQSAATDKQVPGWDNATGLWVPRNTVHRIINGTNITVDETDPFNPIVSSAAGVGATFSGVKVTRTAAYTLALSTSTPVPWDTETYDVGGYHDNAVNNTRLTVPSGQAGKYAVKAGVGSSVSGVSWTRFLLVLMKNGVNIPGSTMDISAGTASFPELQVGTDVDLAVGDYVEVVYYQVSGATRAMDVTKSAMSMFKIG